MDVAIGLQLYSVRESLKRDPWGTLEVLGELGVRRIEAANHNAAVDDGVGFGVPADELTERLRTYGLELVGCHVNPLDLDRLPVVLDYHQRVGNRQIGCDIEFYPYGDRDYVLRRAETFNEIGRLCAERGMRFYYHNHYQEFQELDGTPIYQLILDHTDPELVFLELDTYWMYRGGQDPIDWMRRYPDRVILLHQKDFPADAPQPLNLYDGVVDPSGPITMESFQATLEPRCFTEIGTGTLPIPAIVAAAEALPNFECLLLEQDHTALAELESVRVSLEAFGRLTA
ncbi:sugar phosphate isomerase/epimerase family protein [Microlunatus speluncae]|uniref:sugar phosphate isomerase/epimerase family protein n=1 Tax=Microlunatus speluncae TaxID=2594267 RepID=UPI0012661189|nr:sugar phosphate isomerase/epimerase [Microlunatus speluncae]